MKVNTKNLFIFLSSIILFVSCNLDVKETSKEYNTVTFTGNFTIKDAELYNLNNNSQTNLNRAAFPTMPSSLTYSVEATAADEDPIVSLDFTSPTNSAPGKFSIPLKAGIEWTITITAKGQSQTQTPATQVILFEDSFDFEPSVTESSFSHDFYLRPLTTGTGNINLDLELESELLSGNEDEKISKITYEGFSDSSNPTILTTSPETHNYLNLPNKQAGTYSIIFKFYNSKGALLYATTQTINVYSNLLTNIWHEGSNDLIKENKFLLTKALVIAYGSTDFYVDFTTTLDDAFQYGTQVAPYKKISKAIEVINSITNTNRTYSIHVKNATGIHETITAPIEITGNDISIECYSNAPGDHSGEAQIWLEPSSSLQAAQYINGAIIIKNGLKLILEGKIVNGENRGLTILRSNIIGVTQGLPRCITIDQDSTFVMNGGKISGFRMDASGAQGAGVYIGPNARFIMSGGEISNNIANSEGGGIYISETGLFIMSGGKITENRFVSQGLGGGIYQGGMMYVSGLVYIRNNLIGLSNSSAKNNVYLPAGKTINVNGALSNGNDISEIWFTTEETIAHPGEASKITITEGYDYKEEWSNNKDLTPRSVFKSDNGNPVIFSYYNQNGWGQNPDAATDEVYIAYDGGNIYTTLDYNISMSGSSFSVAPNTEKSISVNFSATRKEANGSSKTLYYNEADKKFYTSYSGGTYTGLAANNYQVTWKKACLYADNFKLADDIDVTISSGASQTITLTIPPLSFEGVFTLKLAADYLGTTFDYNLAFTVAQEP